MEHGGATPELIQIARRILESLSERERYALIRYYSNAEPPEQICAALAMSEAEFQEIKRAAKLRFQKLSVSDK